MKAYDHALVQSLFGNLQRVDSNSIAYLVYLLKIGLVGCKRGIYEQRRRSQVGLGEMERSRLSITMKEGVCGQLWAQRSPFYLILR